MSSQGDGDDVRRLFQYTLALNAASGSLAFDKSEYSRTPDSRTMSQLTSEDLQQVADALHRFLTTDMSPNWIDGVWTGIGFQYEGSQALAWTIKFTADECKNEFRIEYPSLESDGVWKLINKEPAAERYSFNEMILNQRGNTMDGGKVIVTKVNDDYMSFSYFLPPLCETVAAWSTLKRERRGVN